MENRLPNYRLRDAEADLDTLLSYVYSDEQQDYINQQRDGNDTTEHVSW